MPVFPPLCLRFLAFLLLAAAAGCASRPPDPGAAAPTGAPAGPAALRLSLSPSEPGAMPAGWQEWVVRPGKIPTEYRLVRKQVDGHERSVLHAVARSAASGAWVPVELRPGDASYVRWSWRTDALVEQADSSRPETEDAPARLILAFGGDMSRLPLRDQMLAETARMVLGREIPYATLIYTWDSRRPVGAAFPSAHSGRVRFKVVESGPAGLGRWRAYERNYVQDYVELFGEAPGPLIGVGVLTDTDNTRGRAESWYGDIQLLSPERTALGELPHGMTID